MVDKFKKTNLENLKKMLEKDVKLNKLKNEYDKKLIAKTE